VIGRVLVGLDGSADATHALRWTIDLAVALDAEIVAVHVIPVPAYPFAGLPENAAEIGSWADDIRTAFEDEWCAPLVDKGVKYRTLCLEGDPVRGIIEAARREDANLIVIGARGKGPLSRLMLGSVSDRLAHLSPLPVVIVPRER